MTACLTLCLQLPAKTGALLDLTHVKEAKKKMVSVGNAGTQPELEPRRHCALCDRRREEEEETDGILFSFCRSFINRLQAKIVVTALKWIFSFFHDAAPVKRRPRLLRMFPFKQTERKVDLQLLYSPPAHTR